MNKLDRMRTLNKAIVQLRKVKCLIRHGKFKRARYEIDRVSVSLNYKFHNLYSMRTIGNRRAGKRIG
ncbi:hypothetical protein [Paenibacillus sp. J22TS3]|uniref:hypothetical protein n=1 Tax=Paenibacillus sp. J22TS3 TaxID=2807192 RepID=UPI001AFDFCF7|nr:hypothetical protein [Paenibacillus sp. J22TS3]GIP24347.1 hypothetical protein J22TS3_46220 [Paenibacillus sp. J22TS3]